MTTVLQVDHVGYSYANKKGVRDISFQVGCGEVCYLFGKNGSGKSTLLRVLSTLVQPHQGSYRVDGFDARKYRARIRSSLFTVFDENAHFEFATGWENLAFFMAAYHSGTKEECRALGEEMHLDLSMKVGEYSFGMKRKLYLIEAFLCQRHLLLFDEPTLGLDSASRDVFFQWCDQQKSLGRTVVIGTNRLEDVKDGDAVFYLEDGAGKKVESVGSVASRLITVKLTVNDEDVVDHIGDVSELPSLIHRYLSVGALQRIEILNAPASLRWTCDAEEKVERAPPFVQKMIHRLVEEYAKEHGISQITPDVVERARGRFERR